MKQKHSIPTSFQVAEIELTYRANVKAFERPLISASSAANDILSETWDEKTLAMEEQFHVLLLNRANRVLGVLRLPTESNAKFIAYPKLIFTACVKANAVGVIVGHYHPTSDLKSSEQDEKLGKELKYSGSFLDISVLDFVIVTGKAYCSLADQGLL